MSKGSLIVNSTNVKQGERMYQLRLFSNETPVWGHCGAVLVSPVLFGGIWVLTAAHCLKMSKGTWPIDYEKLYLGGGSVDIRELNRRKRITIDRRHIFIHPRWTGVYVIPKRMAYGNNMMYLLRYQLHIHYMYQKKMIPKLFYLVD